jgi:hypothetical protein
MPGLTAWNAPSRNKHLISCETRGLGQLMKLSATHAISDQPESN